MIARLGAATLVVASIGTSVFACGGPSASATWPEAGELRAMEPPAPSTARPRATPPSTPSGPSWDGDEAIAGLAASCAWKAECLAEIQDAAMKSTDVLSGVSAACEPYAPLACARIPLQSCAPDACAQTDYRCVPECDRVCGECADACTQRCDACKAGCRDDACRVACARACGSCHDDCLIALDHCTTAGCGAEAEACFDDLATAWEATDCGRVCPRVATCVEACPRRDGQMEYAFFATPCVEGCFTRLGKGCDGRFSSICKGGDAGAFFHSWYDERKKKATP